MVASGKLSAGDGAPPEGPQEHSDQTAPKVITWLHRLVPPLFLLLVGLLCTRELSHLDLHKLHASIQELPLATLLALQVLGLFAVLAMVLYDWVMCRWMHIALHGDKLLRYSWVANTFNNVVGLSGLTASGIRYLLLTREGVSPDAAASYSGIVLLSAGTGLATLAWPVLFIGSKAIAALPVPAWVAYLALALAAAHLPLYFLLLGDSPIHQRFLKGLPPVGRMQRLALVAVSVLDYALGGLTAWSCVWATGVFVPPDVFAVAFVLAASLGAYSMIPGGLGVFDGVVLLGLSAQGLPTAPVLAGIVLYRLVYYLVPWFIGIYLGAGLLVTKDSTWLAGLARRWEESALLAALRLPLRLLSSLNIRALSRLTLLAGIALLLSAAFPALAARAALLNAYVPLTAVEGSHLLSVVSRVLLIGISRGVASQVGNAYRLAMVLLLTGVVLSLIKGLNVELALFLLVVAGLLRLRKQHFYRLGYPLLSPRNLYWLLALLTALGGYAALGALLHGDRAFDYTLLTHVAHDLAAPRFLRSLLALLVAALAFLG